MSTIPPTLTLIPYVLAARAIEAGVAFAQARGLRLSFAVVDSAGHLVASARMDGAPFMTIEVARGKAFASAASGGQPGDALAKRFSENPMVWGNVASIGFGAPLLPAEGALPIWKEGVLLGAIGASGAPSHIDVQAITEAIHAIGATIDKR